MQPSLEALMTGANALLSTAVAFGAGVARWHRHPPRARGRRVAAARRRVGPYEVLEKIGAGSMGEVHRARHAESGQVRAIKLLAPYADERQRLQFEREARFGEQLSHPNKVSVYDHGKTPEGTLYMSMELLEGMTLDALVERDGALPPRRVLGILLQVAAALAMIHDLGFVHRDVKPSNILVSRGSDGTDHVKLLDFGLIKDLAEQSPSASYDRVVGTPLYISPEALTAPDTVDGRTDLYGLGTVAYHLLSGAPVFGGRSVVEVCAQHLLTQPAPLARVSGGALSSELGQLVLDCLAKDPAARPACARELIRRLRRCPEACDAPRARPSVSVSNVFCATPG